MVDDKDLVSGSMLPGYRLDLDSDTRELPDQLKQYAVDSETVGSNTVVNEVVDSDVVESISSNTDGCVSHDNVDDSVVHNSVVQLHNADGDDKWIYEVDPLSMAGDDKCDTCVNTCDVICSSDNGKPCLPMHLSKMRYRDIMIQETGRNHIGLEDSGAEVCIVCGDLLRGLDVPCLGRIRLRGIVGDSVEADLVRLNVKPASFASNVGVDCIEYSHNIGPFIQIVFAVCDQMVNGQDVILTADAVEKLNQLNDYNVQHLLLERLMTQWWVDVLIHLLVI